MNLMQGDLPNNNKSHNNNNNSNRSSSRTSNKLWKDSRGRDQTGQSCHETSILNCGLSCSICWICNLKWVYDIWYPNLWLNFILVQILRDFGLFSISFVSERTQSLVNCSWIVRQPTHEALCTTNVMMRSGLYETLSSKWLKTFKARERIRNV